MAENNPNIEDLKAPLLATLGAADLALATVNDLLTELRERAEETRSDTRSRVEESRARLTKLQEDVPETLRELRERFTADELRSAAEGYVEAATALGLTTVQTYAYVLLPMAFRIVLPPLTSEFLNTIKNTSVGITIGLLELTGEARSMQEFSFQVFEAFAAATVMYLLLNIVVVVAMRAIERGVAIPGYIAGK